MITVIFRNGIIRSIMHTGKDPRYTVKENCIIVFDDSGSTIYPIDLIREIRKEEK